MKWVFPSVLILILFVSRVLALLLGHYVLGATS